MRRLLYISYFVPPRKAMGSLRCGQLIAHLPAFGWDVTVLTVRFPADVDVPTQYVQTKMFDVKEGLKRAIGLRGRSTHATIGMEIPSATQHHSPVQRLLHVVETLATYPDPQIGWLPYGLSAAKRLVREQRFDAVLSSSTPVTAHFIGAVTKGPTPWVADLRDLWSDNPYLVRSRVHAAAERFLERRTLHRASALVTVSDPLAKILQVRYPQKPVHVVRNGFDEAEWSDIPFGREEKCTMIYAGTLYGGLRDPRPLFIALANLQRQGTISSTTFQMRIYSTERDWLSRAVEEHGLSGIVATTGLIDRRDVLFAERRADCLILFLRDDPSEEGTYTGKLFEYLGARRPILAVGGPEASVVDDVLAKAGAGSRCRTVDALEDRISGVVAAHREGRTIDIPASQTSPYSGLTMAKAFASALDRLR